MFDRRGGEDRAIGSTLRASDPAVRWLLFGVFVNQLGAFVQVFLVLFLVDNGVGEGRAGLALGAYGASSVLGALLGGRLADRLGRRTTMTLAMLVAAALTISISFLGSPELYPLLLLVVIADGAMTQAYRPAASAMLADLVPEDRLVITFSMYRVALNTGAVIGPLVAAWLMTVSWDLLFWADGLTAIACALLVTKRVQAWRATTAATTGIALLAIGLGGYGIEGGLVLLLAASLVGVFGQIVSGPTMFAHPARVAPLAARGAYAGASQAMFGLGAAIGPVLGVLAFDAIGGGVWAVCGGIGALAALAAFAGMRDATPARSRSLSPSPATTGASS